MTQDQARELACREAIRMIEPLDSPAYLALDDDDTRAVDREFREIKTWLRLRAGAAKVKTEGDDS